LAGENEAVADEAADNDALPEADEGDSGLPTVDADDEGDDAPKRPEKAEKADKGKDQPKPKMVDHRALVEARNLLKRERDERQRERERMEQRWAQIIERTTPKQPEPPQPNFDQDPAAWLRHQTENTGKTVNDLAEWRRQQEAQRQQAEQDQHLQYAVGTAEQEFAAEQPDYGDALEFARTSRMNFFRAAGYAPAEAAQIVMQETKILAQRALQAGENPARRIYEIAKTFGYAQKQQGGETKIEQLRKGQRAASPMSGGGAEDENLPSLAALADMEDSEFDKLWGRMKKAGKLG